MSATASQTQQIHDWFLHRGLPLVLTRRVPRALMARSAPMVAGVGALTAVTMLLADWTGDDPDYGYIVRLAIVAAVLAAAPFALYVLHRRDTAASEAGRRTAALAVMAIFVVLMPLIASGWSAAALAECPRSCWCRCWRCGSPIWVSARFCCGRSGSRGFSWARSAP